MAEQNNIPQGLKIMPVEQVAPVIPSMDMDAGTEENSARFSERLIAYVLDSFPFIIFCYGLLWAMIKFMGFSYSAGLERGMMALWIAIYIIYVTVFNSGGRVTLGKKALGIRTVAVDGGNLGVGKSFIRAIGYFISGIPLELGFVAALFGPKRALHDYMAGSRVISTRPKSDFAAGLIFSMAWGLTGIFGASFYYVNIARLPPKEQARVNAATREFERLGAYEEQYRKLHGEYTDDIARLAAISGNAPQFKMALDQVIFLDTLDIGCNKTQYLFAAKVKSRRGTKVTYVGPAELKK